MQPSKLCKYVNKHLPEYGLEGTICECTAARWLNKLGCCVCHIWKGVYVDGHEQEEVIAVRKEYIEFIEKRFFHTSIRCPMNHSTPSGHDLCPLSSSRATQFGSIPLHVAGISKRRRILLLLIPAILMQWPPPTKKTSSR